MSPNAAATQHRRSEPSSALTRLREFAEARPRAFWIALIAGFVFAGFTVQTMVGFGGNVITLALGALVAPIELLVPLIVCMSLLNTSAVLIRNHREVLVGLLLKRVLPLMVVGAVVGAVWSAVMVMILARSALRSIGEISVAGRR